MEGTNRRFCIVEIDRHTLRGCLPPLRVEQRLLGTILCFEHGMVGV